MNKWEFIRNSNEIEEIVYPVEIYKEGCVMPEIVGHERAFDYVLENATHPITVKDILHIHSLLMENLVLPKYRGAFRDCAVYIGGREAFHPISLVPAMAYLETKVQTVKSLSDSWDIHDTFEVIHPFVDGNGRTGRLIKLWCDIFAGLKPDMVLVEDRFKYYKHIDEKQSDITAALKAYLVRGAK